MKFILFEKQNFPEKQTKQNSRHLVSVKTISKNYLMIITENPLSLKKKEEEEEDRRGGDREGKGERRIRRRRRRKK